MPDLPACLECKPLTRAVVTGYAAKVTAEALAALGVDLADAMALWRPAVEAGEEPSSWAVHRRLEAAGAHGLIDPSRTAPGLWHLTLFRWNDDGGPRVRLVEAGT
ncbi:hypothetical protein [Micrococcus luteus]|uniref:hypothetical protein n=1 Tax=Micrococcus luteus TaxID=1270 RepID=UPI0011AB4050|nr:hypothetical protein [Micrococcus luteus]